MPTPNDFANFQFGKDNSAERQQSNLGSSGDYGQTVNAPTADVPLSDYPNVPGYGYDACNPQFSATRAPRQTTWRKKRPAVKMPSLNCSIT
jgi:hypothetical protein